MIILPSIPVYVFCPVVDFTMTFEADISPMCVAVCFLHCNVIVLPEAHNKPAALRLRVMGF